MRTRFAKSAIVSVAAAVMVSGLVGAAPAQAAGWTLNVVALGDSYGSGTGAGDYLNGTGVPNGCWRSANSYSENIVGRLRGWGLPVSFANVTCSGAASTDLSGEFKGQPAQLDSLRSDTHVVFLSIGTSDIDFAGYGLSCVAGDCAGAPTEAELAELPGMGTKVANLLTEIKSRSPWAKIVLTGYGSQLTGGANAVGVPHDALCDPGFFSSAERVDGNRVARGIDATLRATARQANVSYVSPYANSVDLQPEFVGHSLCESGQTYYRGLEALNPGQEGTEAVLHLNKTGQAALTDLVLRHLHW